MKHLILMNPTRRRRTTRRRRKLYGAAAAAHARKVGGGRRRRSSSRRRSPRRVVHTVSHRVRRNPTVRRGRTHSPAMRAKISRAVKAAQRRRSSGGGSIVRRVSSSIRRRRSGGGGGGSFNLSNPFKQIFSKQTLTVAGGAVASSFLTQFILTRYGASLPMANQTFGRVAYKLLIPVAGAAAVKRFNKDLASGMLIGGAVMAINELIASFVPRAGGTQVAALKSYGDETEYAGEADFATDTYMADVATGMPSALSGDDEQLGEYFQGEDPFDSQSAFESAF